jgi:PAS domain S-box-containing protein
LDGDGTITGWSDGAARLFGHRADEAVGLDATLLVTPARRGVVRALLRRLRLGSQADPCAQMLRQDGTAISGFLTLAPVVDATGRVVGVVWNARATAPGAAARPGAAADRPARDRPARALDPQWRKAQRLEGLGRLAGGVAHDFNNIVAVILNYASFLAEDVAAAQAGGNLRWEAARHDIGEIQRAARRAALLTRQLLSFARRDVTQPRVLRLNETVSKVEQMLRRTLGPEIELVTDLAAEPSLVLADPGQLEQLILDLVVNARDAMPDGGTLTIATDNLAVNGSVMREWPGVQPGGYLRVRVTDTGTGMTPEVIEHAFEPFFSTKQNGMGTGLGLATVYGIVTHAEGHVRIDSEVGKGTTFTILLPGTDQPVAPLTPRASSQRSPRGETVLVVEDEEALREVTDRMLRRNGYQVLVAASGPEAERIIREHDGEIHLLVTDVVMPHMLGREVAERVRAMRPDIGVLYMSGYAEPVLASQGRLDAGVVLLEKPFAEADLLAKVAQVLNAGVRAG